MLDSRPACALDRPNSVLDRAEHERQRAEVDRVEEPGGRDDEEDAALVGGHGQALEAGRDGGVGGLVHAVRPRRRDCRLEGGR